MPLNCWEPAWVTFPDGAWQGLSRPQHWGLCLAGGFDDGTLLTPRSTEDWRAWLLNQLFLTMCMSSMFFFQLFPCLSSGSAGAGANGLVCHLPCWQWGLAPLQGREQDLANATAVTWAPPFSHLTLELGLSYMSV